MARDFSIPFGTQGDRVAIPDTLQQDGSVSMSQGFGFDYERPNTDPAYKPIPRDGFNGLMHDMTEALQELQQYGFHTWSAGMAPYETGALVRHNGAVWASVSTNNSEEPGQGSKWVRSAQVSNTTTIKGSTTLDALRAGLIVADASVGPITITLPASNAALGSVEFVIRRQDVAEHAVIIASQGDDRIFLDTTAQAQGQSQTELVFSGDYLALRSDGQGRWWCVGQAQLPASMATGFVVFKEPGVFQWTVPAVLRAGRRIAKITVIGGGGGGSWSYPGSTGGAGGGTVITRLELTGISSVPVTVGLGGIGAKQPGENGRPGGASSFGTYLSATGGFGGLIDAGYFPKGGTSAGGLIRINGGFGGAATRAGYAGTGGGAALAPGAPSSVSGSYGMWPGGGAGSTVYGHSKPAVPGASGAVFIEW